MSALTIDTANLEQTAIRPALYYLHNQLENISTVDQKVLMPSNFLVNVFSTTSFFARIDFSANVLAIDVGIDCYVN